MLQTFQAFLLRLAGPKQCMIAVGVIGLVTGAFAATSYSQNEIILGWRITKLEAVLKSIDDSNKRIEKRVDSVRERLDRFATISHDRDTGKTSYSVRLDYLEKRVGESEWRQFNERLVKIESGNEQTRFFLYAVVTAVIAQFSAYVWRSLTQKNGEKNKG